MGDEGDTLAENARRRAAIARTSRMLKHKLSLSLYKVERGYAHVPFQKLEAALDPATGEVVGIPSVALELAASTSSTASNRQIAPNPANSAFARTRSSTMQTVASDASTSAAASYTIYNASPSASSFNATGASSGLADSGASTSTASQSSQQQQSQAAPSQYSSLPFSVPPTPSSAPASTTAFPTSRNGSVEPKQKRQRRESATPRTQHSSGMQRAGTLTPADKADDASQGHRRKPSQNTIWQQSRAILSGSDNGGLSLGGALTSPAKTNTISTIWEQPLQDSNGLQSQNTDFLISPVRNSRYHPMNAYPQTVGGVASTPQGRPLVNGQISGGTNSTPRHPAQNQQYTQVPHTIAHTGQSYIPYQSSNLSQFNDFLSPQNHYMHAQQPHQQMYAQNMQQHPAIYSMNGQQAGFGEAFDPNLAAQGAYMAMQNAAYPPSTSSQTLNANYKLDPQQRSQSTISRTNSDLSFGQDGTLATLNSSQDSSSLDTELSLSHMPTAHMQPQLVPAPTQQQQTGGNTMARSASSATGTRPVTATGDNGESAAELMLFLAASPSPQQSSKRPPSTLGNDMAGMKGRRLFTNEDMSGLAQHNGGNGQPMAYPSKDSLQQQQQHQHQAYQEVYGAAEGNPFIAQPGYTHLAQPFEYQNALPNHPDQASQMYNYNAYGIANGGLVLDGDYGNAAW